MGIRKGLVGCGALALAAVLSFTSNLSARAQSTSQTDQSSMGLDYSTFKKGNLNELQREVELAPTDRVSKVVLQPLEEAVEESTSPASGRLAIEQTLPSASDRYLAPTQEANTNLDFSASKGVILHPLGSNPSLVPAGGSNEKALQDLDVSVSVDERELVKGAAITEGDRATGGPEDIAQAPTIDSYYRYSAGLDLPNFGWVKMDGGGIDSVLGINLGLGISYKKYFTPAVSNKFNGAFGLGTFALILPYATIGADYQWNSGWFAGGHVGGAVLYFDDEIQPIPIGYISVGYRW